MALHCYFLAARTAMYSNFVVPGFLPPMLQGVAGRFRDWNFGVNEGEGYTSHLGEGQRGAERAGPPRIRANRDAISALVDKVCTQRSCGMDGWLAVLAP